MKYCPSCQSQYTDDTLSFCLQDGTPLRFVAAGPDEQETVVSQRRTGSAISAPAAAEDWPEEATAVARPARTSTASVVLLTSLIVTLLIAFIGIGAYLYLQGGRTPKEDNTLVAGNGPDTRRDRTPGGNSAQANKTAATPDAPKTPLAGAVNSTPAGSTLSQADRELIKKEVSSRITDWKSQIESRNLNAHMESYAETVDYYNRKGSSAAFIRGDKQRAFSAFDSMRMSLSNIRVTPHATGEKATATFDKEWVFEGAQYSAGKVRTFLQLKKVDDRWLITAERDLKVYYTEQ